MSFPFDKPDAVTLAESWQMTLDELPGDHTLTVTIEEMLCLTNWIVNQWRVIQPIDEEEALDHMEAIADPMREEYGSEHFEEEVEDV